MIKKITIGDIRFTFSMARIQKVVGVNSRLPDGKHILMWDFDDTSLEIVKTELYRVLFLYHLPKIIILRSSHPDNYIAYCFRRMDWIDAIKVIVNTGCVDYNFIKYGIYRGRFTLRVSPKGGQQPKWVATLPSEVADDCQVDDLLSWVKYETLKGWL